MTKKVLILSLVLLVVLSMAGCGKKNESAQEPSDDFTFTPSPTSTPEPIPGVLYLDEPVAAPELPDLENHIPAEPIVDNDISDVNVTEIESIESTTTPGPESTSAPIATPGPASDLTPDVTPDSDNSSSGHIPNSTAYEQYNNMSGSEQLAFIESFESVEAFVNWYNAAEADYNAQMDPIEITGGVIDLGELADN